MVEEWRNIKKYEGLYQVSNYGRIKSLPRNGTSLQEKFLKPTLNKKKYLTISLSKNNKKTTKAIHRLVAEAFLFNVNNLPQINHIDGNKQNNRVDNLEYCTPKWNVEHSIKNGLKPNDKGINSVNSKFSKEDIEFIRKSYQKGDKDYGCAKLAETFNVSKSTISYIINNKTYK